MHATNQLKTAAHTHIISSAFKEEECVLMSSQSMIEGSSSVLVHTARQKFHPYNEAAGLSTKTQMIPVGSLVASLPARNTTHK